MPESFKCPSCGAPLEFEKTAMQKCRFCGSNIIAPSPRYSQTNAANFVDVSELSGKALKIVEIQQLIRSGNKIQAIKIFRETFSVGLKEAKDSVDAMERGESVDISGMQIKTAKFHASPQNLDAVKKVGYSIGGSILLTSIIIIIFTLGAIIAGIFLFSSLIDEMVRESGSGETAPTQKTLIPKSGEQKASIAQEILRFGGEGIGAGKFKDNRTIAVGLDGRIYSADYSGGQIQVFDANGNFQTQISVEAERPLLDLVIDRKDCLFVLQSSEISRFDTKTGKFLGKNKVDYASDLAVGADGKIYAATRKDEIAVMNADGVKTKTIKIGEDTSLEEISKLTIDGAGNFYAIDGKTSIVFKLSPEGKFLARFGGKNVEANNQNTKNTFSFTPRDLAVDSKGRIFVSQISKVSIFDADGNFLDDFETTQTFGITFNDADELFTASRPFVVKYKLN